jgi:hypothetical protein
MGNTRWSSRPPLPSSYLVRELPRLSAYKACGLRSPVVDVQHLGAANHREVLGEALRQRQWHVPTAPVAGGVVFK